MKVKLALAQIDTTLGDLDANLRKHMAMIDRAKAESADLILFPELSLTGYALQDLVYEVAITPDEKNPVFKELLTASETIDIVFGFVEEDERHRFYIAAAYLSEGRISYIHRKCYLPTYGLFDEGRFFAEGDQIKAFDTRFGRVGMLICEDYWHTSVPYLLWLDGAELLLMMSAHPARGFDQGEKPGSVRWIDTVSRAYAGIFTTFLAHSLRAGCEDGFTFWGGSSLFGPDGELIAGAETIDETLVFAELDFADLRHTRARLPLLRDERVNLTYRNFKRIMRGG